jgi:methanogenic corrinoid protein MtbC1
MPAMPSRAGYSIAAVSKLTGVSCHALRVWERRYGFPVPDRSASGHRRYAQEQVRVLRYLAALAIAGPSIGELIGEFQAGKLEIRGDGGAKAEAKSMSTPVVDRLFEGDVASAEALIDRVAEQVSTFELIERVIEPAMVDVGERWFRGECQVYQERCATASLLARLWQMIDRARRANPDPARSVLVGAVQGDLHEGGVLMVSLALELAGWRAVPMGVNLPIEEYRKAIESWRPDALALSFVLSRNINKRFQELSKIRSVPIFVGGRSIVNHQSLARRYGLIPLTGSLKASSSQLTQEVEARKSRESSSKGLN